MKIPLMLSAFTVIAVSACHTNLTPNTNLTPHTQPSKVFANFALEEIIKRVPDSALEVPQGFSTGSGGGGSSEFSSYRKQSQLNCKIRQEGNGFDEGAFMTSLKAEVEKEVTAGGANIHGKGGYGSDFFCDYQLGKINGIIEVTGMRGEGNIYKLSYVIRELSWK